MAHIEMLMVCIRMWYSTCLNPIQSKNTPQVFFKRLEATDSQNDVRVDVLNPKVQHLPCVMAISNIV